jgi:hypothetical protein
MFIKKLSFQRTEKVVEFGGERYDLKHERQPPMGLVCVTIFIGWFAFLFDIPPSFFHKKVSQLELLNISTRQDCWFYTLTRFISLDEDFNKTI